MAKCIVTGHKGYIGSKIYEELISSGHEVIGIDTKDNNDVLKVLGEHTDGKFHPHYFNFKPDYIFHLAAWPRVAFSVENPVKTMKNNVLSTTCVLNFARKVSAKRVIFSSSSSVIGKDVVSANMFAMNYDEDFNGEVFDVGTGNNISLNEVKNIVLETLPEIDFDYVEERVGDVLLTKANTEPLKKLGWKACVDINQGLIECFKGLK